MWGLEGGRQPPSLCPGRVGSSGAEAGDHLRRQCRSAADMLSAARAKPVGMDAVRFIGLQSADQMRSEKHLPANSRGLKSDAFPFEGFADVTLLRIQADHPFAFHKTALPSRRIRP